MLEQELQAKGMIQGDNIIATPPGAEKMSAVIIEFMAPYAEVATSLAKYKQLVELAVVAWNTALMPKKEREILLNERMKNAFRPYDEDRYKEFRSIVMDLIRRKQRYFAENKRLIISFRVSETKDQFHLAIASTP